ncbi:MAG: hypothetical protein ACP5NX_04195 [Candidatus Bilamarchaeaceae archaeon]
MSGNLPGALIIGFLVGAYYIYEGVRRYRLVQKINNTATSKVEAVALGLVELSGNAKQKDGLVSPISKAPCAYWRLVFQYYKSGKHGGWREYLKLDSSSSKFSLKDETGEIVIDPKGGKMELPHDRLFNGYLSGQGIFGMKHEKMPQEVLDFIASVDGATKRKALSHANENVRVYEYYIADGDELYVLGTARPGGPASSPRGHENLVVGKTGNEVLYISDSREETISKGMGDKVRLYIIGGLAVSAVCLFILLVLAGIK